MIVQYFSDLHLELSTEKDILSMLTEIDSGVNDICICAGDIGNPFSKEYDIFMNFLSLKYKKIFVIAVNSFRKFL